MTLEVRPRSAMKLLIALFIIWIIVVLVLTLKEYKNEANSLRREVSVLRELNLQMRTAFSDLEILGENLVRYVAPQKYIQKAKHKGSFWTGLSLETRNMLLNMTGLKELPFERGNGSVPISIPTILDILPHLKNDSYAMVPAFHIAKNPRRKVSIVMGIPTVKRKKASYLITSLQSLLSSMSSEEEKETLIVIFIAETDIEYVKETAKTISDSYPRQVDSGLIELLSPRATYYPAWDTLTPTLGDSKDHFLWRSKAAVDYVYLMMYSYTRGTYFLQLEDDVVTKPGFISEIHKAVDEAKTKSWFLIDFSELGYIGKLFHDEDLPSLINFYAMFYNAQPVDWLFPNMLMIKLCKLDLPHAKCNELLKIKWLSHTPSLFQHIGTYSSLAGKTQRLKDTKFGNLTLYWPHTNPPAYVSTSIQQYKKYSLEGAYNGKDLFWGIKPTSGDHLTFNFVKTVNITRYLFRSGNIVNTEDKFYNTSVEILSAKLEDQDTYQHIGWVNELGVAEGNVNSSLWPIKSFRLRVQQESKFWIIISEILLSTNSTIPEH